jgi:glutamyl-tRNA synthetase
MSKVRVRIAPSPTGNLHVGTARSALFNELFARNQGGKFIVRVEDTDPARSKLEYEQNILEGMKWLGMTWDEGPDVGGALGPYRQSERAQTYQKAIEQLLSAGKAYEKDEAVWLKVEDGEISFEDLVRGTVTTKTDAWGGDFVIARKGRQPVFHLAVVVDDAAMEITHVIRGEDHLSNTARHILIQRALGYTTPQYAHIPLLLDDQRRKLSKRRAETSLLAYRDLGYLPEAMLNYLALLGWSPKRNQEFFTHEELIKAFSLAGIQKGGAIFSLTKLQAVNKHYLRLLSGEELYEHAKPFLHLQGVEKGYVMTALKTEQERAGTLKELAESIQYLMPNWAAEYDAEILIWKKTDAKTMREKLEAAREKIESLPDSDFESKKLEEILLKWVDENKLGRGDTLWPLRVALTGRENSTGPFEVAAVLGKTETLRRIDVALEKLNAQA